MSAGANSPWHLPHLTARYTSMYKHTHTRTIVPTGLCSAYCDIDVKKVHTWFLSCPCRYTYILSTPSDIHEVQCESSISTHTTDYCTCDLWTSWNYSSCVNREVFTSLAWMLETYLNLWWSVNIQEWSHILLQSFDCYHRNSIWHTHSVFLTYCLLHLSAVLCCWSNERLYQAGRREAHTSLYLWTQLSRWWPVDTLYWNRKTSITKRERFKQRRIEAEPDKDKKSMSLPSKIWK